MKYKNRLIYILIVMLTIAAGLFVRVKKQWFPETVNLYAGDALYAFMMYYIICVLLPRKKLYVRAVLALLICYVIEFSQLYQAEWINTVRQTLPGRLILGSGFLYSDLIAYAIGISAAVSIDYLFIYNRASPSNSRLK